MAQDFARRFYHSKAWESTQRAYMMAPVEVPGHGTCPPYMCERCFAKGRLVPAVIVHHKIWLTPSNIDDPDVTLNPDNLMRVCRQCHADIHYPGVGQRVRFGPNGEVLPLERGEG